MRTIVIPRRKIVILYALLFLLLITNLTVSYNSVRRVAYAVGRNVLEKKIVYTMEGEGVRTSKQFVIKYHKEDAKYIDMILDSANEHYQDLAKDFSYTKKDPIYIIVYSSVEEMRAHLKLPATMNPMGLYYGRTLNILSPRAWIEEKDLESMRRIFEREGPMTHELTHLFVDEITMGNYPLWFTEGMALYMEKKYTGFQWGEGQSIDTEGITIKKLTEDFSSIDELISYKKSVEIIEQWVDSYGEPKVMQLLHHLAKGLSLQEAVYREFKIFLRDL